MKRLEFKKPLLLGDFDLLSLSHRSPHAAAMEEVRDKIAKDFEIDRAEIDKYQIYVAFMDETGAFFEASGSHCSCYGFEEQFAPEPTTLEYLKSDNFGQSGVPKDLVIEFLKNL